MTETMQTIKDLMKHQHISQRNMAEKVGVAEATMSRWINGTRNPDIQYVERMIKILSYKLSYGDMENVDAGLNVLTKTDTHSICVLCVSVA